MSKIEVVTSTERRRRFSEDEKIRIIEEARQPGSTMLAMARKYGVSNSLLYEWQKRLGIPPKSRPAKPKGLDAVTAASHSQFVRLPAPAKVPIRPAIGCVRLSFQDGLTVDLPSGTAPEEVAALIRALRS